MTCIKPRVFIILPSIVVSPWGPHSRSKAQTLLQQTYCKPITQRQALSLRAGSPRNSRCPAIVLLWPPATAVLSCQQQFTCFTAGSHQRLGFAASEMLTTCFARRPARLRNGTMKTLSFPGPQGCCFWIISAMHLLQSLRAASLTPSPCQLPAPASAPLQPSLPPWIPHLVSMHR